jgi:hypothetical protein
MISKGVFWEESAQNTPFVNSFRYLNNQLLENLRRIAF